MDNFQGFMDSVMRSLAGRLSHATTSHAGISGRTSANRVGIGLQCLAGAELGKDVFFLHDGRNSSTGSGYSKGYRQGGLGRAVEKYPLEALEVPVKRAYRPAKPNAPEGRGGANSLAATEGESALS